MCASSQSDSFDLPCTTLRHFRIDAHNPAPRITFGKENVCVALSKASPVSVKTQSAGTGSICKRPTSRGLYVTGTSLPSGIPISGGVQAFP